MINKEKLVRDIATNIKRFDEVEPRGYVYRISRELIESKWDSDIDVAEALCLLLRIWNGNLYRYDFFEIDKLRKWITRHRKKLNKLRKDKITIDNVTETEYAQIVKIFFNELIEATRTKETRKNSPVGVAKILHLLLPDFFPLWDNAIAGGMGVMWNKQKNNYAERYLECCIKILFFKNKIKNNSKIKQLITKQKGILKIIDEFNFIYFTEEGKKDSKHELYPNLTTDEKSFVKSIMTSKNNKVNNNIL